MDKSLFKAKDRYIYIIIYIYIYIHVCVCVYNIPRFPQNALFRQHNDQFRTPFCHSLKTEVSLNRLEVWV